MWPCRWWLQNHLFSVFNFLFYSLLVPFIICTVVGAAEINRLTRRQIALQKPPHMTDVCFFFLFFFFPPYFFNQSFIIIIITGDKVKVDTVFECIW